MKEYKGGRPYYGYSVGVLMLDMEAPLIPGNVGNAMSYDFPVLYKVLEGLPADWWCDEIGPDESRCQIFIDAAKELEAKGCKAITSGCGFFAIYQKRVAEAVNIPVFLSPLLMVPMLSRMLGGNRVGILTAGGAHLKGDFLKTVGIDETVNYAVGGLENTEEFYNVHVTCKKKNRRPGEDGGRGSGCSQSAGGKIPGYQGICIRVQRYPAVCKSRGTGNRHSGI